MKSFTLNCLLLALTLTGVYAQTPGRGNLTGKVTDAGGKPLEFATLMLVKSADSTKLVKGAISDAGGAYAFENIAFGEYRVAAQQMGFAKTYSQPFALDAEHASLDLPTLALPEESKALKEVQVVAKKPFIEQQIDRTVVNVENSIAASGGTALDVLEKAPGVTIDRQNDQIQLKGKQGVVVMIDGKQTYLSTQEVSNLLKNTPSDNIATIEIITNPSSKYDASGNSGIINIKMKKNKNFGTNGTLTLGVGYGVYEKANAGLVLNHRVGKINAFGNYNYFHNHGYQENQITRVIPFQGRTTYFDQRSIRPNFFDGHRYRTGLDYSLGKRSTVGVLLSGYVNDWRQPDGVNNTIIRDQTGQITLKPTTRVEVLNRWDNLTGNLNYKYDWGKGRELTADADYVRYNGDSYNHLTTTYTDAQDRPVQNPLLTRNTMPSTIDIWAGKADYVHPTAKGAKWELGVKTSQVRSDNDLVFENSIDGRWVNDATRSNRFQYTETIRAGYVNWAGKLSKRTSLQAGLRLENTESRGHSITLDKVVARQYTNLFPTLFLSRQVDTNNVLNLSYSRRIDRPNYQDLNPFVFFLDPYTYQQGNPYLKPQFTHSLELTHVFKGTFSTKLGYSRTTDVIVREVPGQIPEQNVTYVMADNLATQDNVNLTLSFPLTVRKWWTMQNNVTAYWNKYNSAYLGAQYNVSVLAYNLYVSNNFVLGKVLRAS